MTNAIIFGSGKSKFDYPQDLKINWMFKISCNMAYPNADLIFAIDDPIIEKLLSKDIEGFRTQSIYTTVSNYERFDYDKRVLLIDDRRYFTGQGLGTGIIAIGTALKLGFDNIFLSGFEFTKSGSSIVKLHDIISSKDDLSKIFRIADVFIDDIPINQITVHDFLTQRAYAINEFKFEY